MMPVFTKIARKIQSLFVKETSSAFVVVETSTTEFTKTVDGYVAPVRKTIFRRFPVLFSLLVTFGVCATFLGMEQLILRSVFLQANPEYILFAGMSILVFTGTLYKKLG